MEENLIMMRGGGWGRYHIAQESPLRKYECSLTSAVLARAAETARGHAHLLENWRKRVGVEPEALLKTHYVIDSTKTTRTRKTSWDNFVLVCDGTVAILNRLFHK